MKTRITAVETFCIRLPREVPYLGKLEDGVEANENGYFVRPGNLSVYSIHDQSTLVRITTEGGVTGWGECVGFVVPQATKAIIDEMLGPWLMGQDASDPAVLYHRMYDLMRVRGFFGGYYHDALAGVDIALWDTAARSADLPLCKMLGGQRWKKIPAYVSGLPMPTLAERVDLALSWQAKGFNAFKFASAVSHEGTAEEMKSLREALGPRATILCDMHWKHTAPEAIRLIQEMNVHRLAVAEAPCRPEDIEGQAQVAAAVSCPVGIGEELRTSFEYLPRFERRAIGVIQPEMGRTGITSFMEIAALGRAFHVKVMPHASIGIGLFQAASLHASAVMPHLELHEYQHSIFDKNLQFISGDMSCEDGMFTLPTGPGLGVAPTEEVLTHGLEGLKG
ncbi:MAG: mandelate racemase/muconate lactonizing enzyme family protein [Kiritimatiellia bacterium]